MQGVLAPVLDALGVTFRVMKGFSSFTAVMSAVHELNGDRPCVALYLGDHDPSGLWMSERDLPERLARYGGRQELRRIAILADDTAHLPHFDVETKKGDARHRWFVERYGRRCWELDSMDPNNLRARVSGEIEAYIEWPRWTRAIEIEASEVESMNDCHAAWKNQLGSRQ